MFSRCQLRHVFNLHICSHAVAHPGSSQKGDKEAWATRKNTFTSFFLSALFQEITRKSNFMVSVLVSFKLLNPSSKRRMWAEWKPGDINTDKIPKAVATIPPHEAFVTRKLSFNDEFRTTIKQIPLSWSIISKRSYCDSSESRYHFISYQAIFLDNSIKLFFWTTLSPRKKITSTSSHLWIRRLPKLCRVSHVISFSGRGVFVQTLDGANEHHCRSPEMNQSTLPWETVFRETYIVWNGNPPYFSHRRKIQI